MAGKPFDVDLVFCIDADMNFYLPRVKENAVKLVEDLAMEMKWYGYEIRQMRVRLIAFRDYKENLNNGVLPMKTTPFFVLPEQNEAFRKELMSIQPEGGRDEPKDGLEALALAIRSDWMPKKPGIRRRQIIVLWSDVGTHELGHARGTELYPSDMARDFDELTRWWGDAPSALQKRQAEDAYMDCEEKRLLIYAPDIPWWSTISSSWPNMIHVPVVTGEGLAEQDYRQTIRLLFVRVA